VRGKKPQNAAQCLRVGANRHGQLSGCSGSLVQFVGDGKIGDDVQGPRQTVTTRHLSQRFERIGLNHGNFSCPAGKDVLCPDYLLDA
jgi:hypothetical protein